MCGVWSCVTFQTDRAGGRVRFDMADADVPADDAEGVGDAGALAGETDARLAAGFFEHFDVGPGDPAAPAGAEDFEHRFFGGETSGEMLEIALGVFLAIVLFRRGVDAVEEALPVLVHQPLDANSFDNVDAVAENGHASRIRPRRAADQT